MKFPTSCQYRTTDSRENNGCCCSEIMIAWLTMQEWLRHVNCSVSYQWPLGRSLAFRVLMNDSVRFIPVIVQSAMALMSYITGMCVSSLAFFMKSLSQYCMMNACFFSTFYESLCKNLAELQNLHEADVSSRCTDAVSPVRVRLGFESIHEQVWSECSTIMLKDFHLRRLDELE